MQGWQPDELAGPAGRQLENIRRKLEHVPGDEDRRGEDLSAVWTDRR